MIVLAMFGWFCLTLFLTSLSIAYGVVMLNTLGRYNIGGVPNSFATKAVVYFGFVVLLLIWGFVFYICPFSLILK